MPSSARWLLLIHQIPPRPAYLRVKIWRRLQRLGAVPIKNSVYALPASEAGREDLQWVGREIEEGGGSVSVCEAQFVEGLTDDRVQEIFNGARDADYAQLDAEARRVRKEAARTGRAAAARRGRCVAALARLQARLAEIEAIDFFGAPGRSRSATALEDLGLLLRPAPAEPAAGPTRAALPDGPLKGRTWVTRRGVHIDRIACAWLIRRFIDPKARFKFVASAGYEPSPGEIRFDMYDAEFTHQGNRCTFEVLLDAAAIRDPALRPIAEIVHDIDMKDALHGRPEAAGIDRLIRGLSAAHAEDAARLDRGAAIFDDLHQAFRGGRG